MTRRCPVRRFRRGLACAMAALGLLLSRADGASADTGSDALAETRRLDAGPRRWTSRRQQLNLSTKDSRGARRERELVILARKEGEDERTLTVFLSPPEVRGTAFLQISHADQETEQWIFLPALGRVRRITSRARDQSFVGTAFSYRDLELLTDAVELSEEQAPSRLLEDAGDAPGKDGRIRVERRSGERELGYDKLVVDLETPAYVVRELRFVGADGAGEKRLVLDDIRQIGAIPTPHRLVMNDAAKGAETTVVVTKVVFGDEMPDDLFTEQGLEDALDLIEN